MRILIIVSEYPPVASGVARSVDRLARGLRGYGHEVDILSGADAPYFVSGQVRLSGLGGRLLRLGPDIAGHYDLVNVHGPVPTISDCLACAPAGHPSPRRAAGPLHPPLDARVRRRIARRARKRLHGRPSPAGPPRRPRRRHQRGVRRPVRGQRRLPGLRGAVGRRRRALPAGGSHRLRRRAAAAGAPRRPAATVQGRRGRDRRRRPPAGGWPSPSSAAARRRPLSSAAWPSTAPTTSG